MAERPVTAKDLRLIVADPDGPCSKPPCLKTIRGWIAMGMPFVVSPGQSRKHFLVSKVKKWIVKHRKGE